MTKNILSLLAFSVMVSILLGSCRKYTPVDTADQVGASRVTYYATLTLNGEPYMSIVKGETFTDPGAIATAQDESLPVTVSGTVDNTTEGIYILNYSAVNKDGYSAATSRYVAVLPSHEVVGTDISGSYYYISSPSATSSVTKVAEGFYSTTNVWSAATTIPGLFITVDGTNIDIPSQTTGYGTMFGTGTLKDDGSLTYIVSIPSQGLDKVARRWHKAI